jgi:hypothetical protein
MLLPSSEWDDWGLEVDMDIEQAVQKGLKSRTGQQEADEDGDLLRATKESAPERAVFLSRFLLVRKWLYPILYTVSHV